MLDRLVYAGSETLYANVPLTLHYSDGDLIHLILEVRRDRSDHQRVARVVVVERTEVVDRRHAELLLRKIHPAACQVEEVPPGLDPSAARSPI